MCKVIDSVYVTQVHCIVAATLKIHLAEMPLGDLRTIYKSIYLRPGYIGSGELQLWGYTKLLVTALLESVSQVSTIIVKIFW